MTRATAWLALAVSMSALACAGVNTPASSGTGGSPSSTSGAGGSAGAHANGQGGSTGVQIGVGGSMCGLQTFDVNRKPVEIFLVLDRSASMEDGLNDSAAVSPTNPTKWSQLIPALTATLQQADATISWGLKAFPEKGSGACGSNTVTPKIDLTIAPSNAAQLSTTVQAILDNGDGTPTGAAIRVATTYLQGLAPADDSRKYILLATDGEPSCAGSAGALTADSTAARTDAVAAVTAAAAAGFHTFVVGVATTKANDQATLNQLAIAGLEPSADTRPGATRFYLASNQTQLATTLEGIVNPVASNCVFPLNKAPPVPENIAVKVNGNKAPPDTGHTNGWDYTDPAYTGVQVYGSWCDMIKNNGNTVEIIFGCPGIIIP